MDLNRLHSGKKLIDKVIKQGNIRSMGWDTDQQMNQLNVRKNPHTPDSKNNER